MAQHYGLIGFPLGHSFSSKYFTEKFVRDNIDASYDNYPMQTVDGLPALVDSMPQLRGLNVTVPHKQAVMGRLDEIDPVAASIGAVNVIRISHDSNGRPHLKGFNTDWQGFRDSLLPLVEGGNHTKALVLGTGGASQAVAYALRSLGIAPTPVSRTPGPGRLTYTDLTPAEMASHTVIVNATPLGTFPAIDTCPPIPYESVSPDHVCHDLVYNPSETLFMRKCALQGAKVANGLAMLHRQAELSWEIWQQ